MNERYLKLMLQFIYTNNIWSKNWKQ